MVLRRQVGFVKNLINLIRALSSGLWVALGEKISGRLWIEESLVELG